MKITTHVHDACTRLKKIQSFFYNFYFRTLGQVYDNCTYDTLQNL